MKSILNKVVAVAAGIFLAASLTVNAIPVYNNTSTDSGSSLNFSNGTTIGNQIILGGGYTSALLNNFSFEFYSSNSASAYDVTMSVFLYANDGTPFNGYATPGTTLLFSENDFTLTLSPGTDAATLHFDVSSQNITVPGEFTLAATVTGLHANDILGFEMFTGPTVGSNHQDYWMNDGNWSLHNLPQNNTGIGASFDAISVAPEPSTFCLGAVGGSMLLGSVWLRRRKQQCKQVC